MRAPSFDLNRDSYACPSAEHYPRARLRMIAYVRLVEASSNVRPLIKPKWQASHERGMMLAHDRTEAFLEQGYWLRRKREELAMASHSTSAEARLIHFDLAGRYSVKASNSGEAAAHFAAHSEAWSPK